MLISESCFGPFVVSHNSNKEYGISMLIDRKAILQVEKKKENKLKPLN